MSGTPQGKGRPRFNARGKFVRTYTPEKTKSYEELIAYECLKQCNPNKYYTGAIKMRICAYFEPSNSISNKKRQQLIYCLSHKSKPDIDNIIKIVCDSLNGIAYKDDSQICMVLGVKEYAEKSRLEVEIEYLEIKEE